MQRMTNCEIMQNRSKLCILRHPFFKYRLQNDCDQSAPKVTRKSVRSKQAIISICFVPPSAHTHTRMSTHKHRVSWDLILWQNLFTAHSLRPSLWECYDSPWWTQSFKSNPSRLWQQFQTLKSAQISNNHSVFAVEDYNTHFAPNQHIYTHYTIIPQ